MDASDPDVQIEKKPLLLTSRSWLCKGSLGPVEPNINSQSFGADENQSDATQSSHIFVSFLVYQLLFIPERSLKGRRGI